MPPTYNPFSIAFISAALGLFYATSLIGRGDRQRALPLLVGSFIRAPRLVKLHKVQPNSGHCYIAETDLETTDVDTGGSPFLLLEDDRPLGPPVKAIKDIREKGGGRHMHKGRRIFFSPSDNADLRQTPRRYALLETLTRDEGKIAALEQINAQRSALSNDGLWLLAKLQVYCGAQLKIARTAAVGQDGLQLEGIEADGSALGLGRFRAGTAALHWTLADSGWSRLDLSIPDLSGDWLPASAALQLSLGFTQGGALRLDSLRLHCGGAEWAEIALDWDAEGRLRQGRARSAVLDRLRSGLIQTCGNAETLCKWLGDILAAIRSDALPLACRIDDDTAATLTAALDPDGTAVQLALTLTRTEDRMAVAAQTS